MAPGLIEQTSTSASGTSLRNASRAAAFFRSMLRERLLRFTFMKTAPMPGVLKGVTLRVTSPSRDSTLMTSAPMSPMICVA